MGLLNEVTQVISRQLNVNIRKLTIETNDGIFEGKIQLWVHDVEDVKTICNNLKKIQNIKQVYWRIPLPVVLGEICGNSFSQKRSKD